MALDLFDDVFTIEDRIYSKGYDQGFQDGVRAGKIEGRALGMEKGCEKFLQSGRIAGKCIIWANRLAQRPQPGSASGEKSSETCTLPPLPKNPRLEKNIRLAYALVNPDTLSTQNTDEAVEDFDDRLKKAQGKVKIIEKMLK
ncbi:hypothetical protein ACQKWADRAFT_281810 [Trichoderma austrokoningii]